MMGPNILDVQSIDLLIDVDLLGSAKDLERKVGYWSVEEESKRSIEGSQRFEVSYGVNVFNCISKHLCCRYLSCRFCVAMQTTRVLRKIVISEWELF